jgi:ribosome maturation factor RimP
MELLKLIEQTAEGLGYELVDFETSPRGRLMRVFIDSPNGITVDDCATVSNQLTRIFEVENIDYDRLEVSSRSGSPAQESGGFRALRRAGCAASSAHADRQSA